MHHVPLSHRLRRQTTGTYGYRDSKTHAYGQVTAAQDVEPCWRKHELALPLRCTDVSPGGAAVPEAGLGITKEGEFWQKAIHACT
jgi:hypothetical protein